MENDSTTKVEVSQDTVAEKPEVIKPKKKSNAGRPTERTAEINRKIEEASALGASIEEIAYYAGVHRATLYRWMEADPELRDRIQELQERPILKARQTIIKSLDNPVQASWYLERKRRNEFATRSELTGANGTNLFELEKDEKQKLDDLLDGKPTRPIAIPAEPESISPERIEGAKQGSNAGGNQWHAGSEKVSL